MLPGRRSRHDVRDAAARVAAVALAALVSTAACSGGGGDARTPRPAAPDSRATRAGSQGSGAPSTAPSPNGTDVAATPLAGRSLRRGGQTWGVYFAVSDFGDPDVERAAARLEAQGHEPSTLSLECDRGAAQALGVPEERAAVALYFGSEDDARAFAATAEPAPDGIARVETRCID